MRINLQHSLRFGKRAITVAFARLNRYEFQIRVFFCESRLDMFDPFVLIACAQRSRDDGKLAFVVEDSGGFIRKRITYALRPSLD